MFLGTEQQRQTGLRHIAHLKDTHFSDKRNKVENIFDNAPDKWKTTLCFHAGLKRRHVHLPYGDMTSDEQLKIIQALLSLRHFSSLLRGDFY
ncbi:DUF5347 family protein [Rahnella sp. EDr1-12]|uniref:DUF5347 family protein n=1 Tax=unclassified Rahnella TaxID=2635087 RepID=UPI003BA84239